MIPKFCLAKLCFANPDMLLLIIPIIFLLIVIINIDFIKFKTKQEKESYRKSKEKIRKYIIVFRSLIFVLLIIAFTSPYTEEETMVKGDPKLTILADNSSSFELFDKTIAPELGSKLEKIIPIKLAYIASGEKSAIGDGILNNIQGDDNILIVSDGNNNYGRDLGDMMLFASLLNTTISALKIEPIKNDIGVSIEGPYKVIVGTDNTFTVRVNEIGEALDYNLEVLVDGATVIGEKKGKTQEFTTRFSYGNHKITAKITRVEDYFLQNNVFYKTVKAVARPAILFVSEKSSPMHNSLSKIYDVTLKDSLDEELSGYEAVVINDIKADKLKANAEKLSDFVADGNGLIVFGGENSFNNDPSMTLGYTMDKDINLYKAMLPVQTGTADEEEGIELNLVILIDISGSTTERFGDGSSNSVLDVEKALAIKILNDMDLDDKVAVVAFTTQSHLISPLTTIVQKEGVMDKIKKLYAAKSAGTVIGSGIRRAEYLLSGATGTKAILLMSDGGDAIKSSTLQSVKLTYERGVKTFAVGIGVGGNVDSQFLKELTNAGHGVYLQPSETQSLKVLFGGAPEEGAEGGKNNLVMLNRNFDRNYEIPSSFNINGKVDGYNLVVAKPAAKAIVTTGDGIPIISVWRYGLGRVVAVTTDDGSKWSGSLLSERNSEVVTRSINWAIGDLRRKKSFDVEIKDTIVNEATDVDVMANIVPTSEKLEFSKVGPNLYTAKFTPTEIGFHQIMGALVAANYNDEYLELGLNKKLEDLVTMSGGYMLDPNDIDDIVEKVKTMSTKMMFKTTDYRWPFALAALVIFLLEIFVRRLFENRAR